MAQYPPPPQNPYHQPAGQQGPPPSPYGQPGPYAAPPQNSGAATFSLIAGLLSISFCPGLASLAAIIAGHRAKSQIRNSYGRLGGAGMATAGLIMGYFSLVISLIGACLLALNFTVVMGLLMDSGL
jgi:hypothetical protein